MKKIVYVSIVLVATGLFALSCSKDDDQSVPDESTTLCIKSFSPSSGDHGATVEITGKNFASTAAGNKVTFNGQTATIDAATTTLLTVTVPEGATTGKIEVEVDGEEASSSTNFSVVDRKPTISLTPDNDYKTNRFEVGESVFMILSMEVPEGLESFDLVKSVDGETAASVFSEEIKAAIAAQTEGDVEYAIPVDDAVGSVVVLTFQVKDTDDEEFTTVTYEFQVVAQGQGGSGGKYPLLNVYNNLETPITLGSQGNFEIGNLFKSSNGDVYTNGQAEELSSDDRITIDMAFGVLGLDGTAGDQFPNLISPHLLAGKEFADPFGNQAPETTFRAEEEMNFASITSTDVDQIIDHSTGTVLDNIAITKDGIYSFVNGAGVKGYIQVISVTGEGNNRTTEIKVLSQILP
ncbi:IPT/TIG domain-containing protein [Muricauda sp. 2012CJ35-5]|uniref:IPT/TIG domain-containing protein n=1 Tax=Flagellimonas spongiicola TaxID=2942208 RepID=A0ABT0PRX5_9FLAO|nr:IPT/TIG domain-containing protein [Allomuricauda spongiicola]MCL6274137.1 IPT/TIG domain-containing protein [Allomuricauda spongiicola]